MPANSNMLSVSSHIKGFWVAAFKILLAACCKLEHPAWQQKDRVRETELRRHPQGPRSEQCLSACTIMFLGGRERYISESGRLGFHQPDFPGLKGEDRRAIIAQEQTRLRRLGVSDAFARKALQAKPDDMWFPALTELLNAGVVTRVVQSSDFALPDTSTRDHR